MARYKGEIGEKLFFKEHTVEYWLYREHCYVNLFQFKLCSRCTWSLSGCTWLGKLAFDEFDSSENDR